MADPLALAAERLRQTEDAYRDRQATDGELDRAERDFRAALAGKPPLTSWPVWQKRRSVNGKPAPAVLTGIYREAMPGGPVA